MKRISLLTLTAIAGIMFLTGCLNLQLGGGTTNRPQAPTTGQQLIDLQQARDKGAITDTEYQTQKARLLEHK